MKTLPIASGLFGCLGLFTGIAHAADTTPSLTPPPPAQSATTNLPSVQFTEWTLLLREKALQAGDQEVAAAAEYNLLHLVAVGTNDTEARAALETLAESGDESTLTWLEKHPPRTSTPERSALIQKTKEQSRHRLQISPVPPEKLVRPRMLRTAVADLTCNALEVELKVFAWSWARRHCMNDAVRAELRRFDQPDSVATPFLSPASICQRAAGYADFLLKPPQHPSR